MENFKQYNKIMFKQNDMRIRKNVSKENDKNTVNLIRHTNPKGETNSFNVLTNKNAVTPSTVYKINAAELSAQTN